MTGSHEVTGASPVCSTIKGGFFKPLFFFVSVAGIVSIPFKGFHMGGPGFAGAVVVVVQFFFCFFDFCINNVISCLKPLE